MSVSVKLCCAIKIELEKVEKEVINDKFMGPQNFHVFIILNTAVPDSQSVSG